ncbi:MAG: hypothetical protein H7145_07780 [Akkermansiaceae bacterium]|nr:hypothetical protein [Armatimonadota bacterium]
MKPEATGLVPVGNLLLALMPLLLLWDRSNDEDRTPVAVAGASPGGTMATDRNATSRNGSAALPPAGGGTSTDTP